MSGTGDLRAVLAYPPMGTGSFTDDILAALAAADEPLVGTVEVPQDGVCPTCFGSRSDCPDAWPNHTRTVRGVWLTEDVLRARLREVVGDGWIHDELVRALLGEATDE